MDFCIIAPTVALNRYSTLSKTHLVLPHIHDDDYWDFYEGRRSKGDRIILDNGAYEGREFHELRFTSLLRYLKPQVAVLPDYLLQPWEKTWHASIAFLDRWAEKFPDVEWMYVPQAFAGQPMEWQKSLEKGLEDPRIRWVGLPRAMTEHIFNDPIARIWQAKFCQGFRPSVKIHCLGMDAGNVHELPYLAKVGVTSIDSSAPVWRGWNGWRLNEKKQLWNEPWPDFPIDFDAKPAIAQVHKVPDRKQELTVTLADNFILQNLEACGIDTTNAWRDDKV